MTWTPVEGAPEGVELLTTDGESVTSAKMNKYKQWEPLWLSVHGCGCCSEGAWSPTHFMAIPDLPLKKYHDV